MSRSGDSSDPGPIGIVHAVFENGVFHPQEPVALAEGSEVEFKQPRLIERETSRPHRRRVHAPLSRSIETGEPDMVRNATMSQGLASSLIDRDDPLWTTTLIQLELANRAGRGTPCPGRTFARDGSGRQPDRSDWMTNEAPGPPTAGARQARAESSITSRSASCVAWD